MSEISIPVHPSEMTREQLEVEVSILRRKAGEDALEIKSLLATTESFEAHLKEQFDAMQVSLIGFVMYKCGRKSLVIDSREILAAPFSHQYIDVEVKDGYHTAYNVRSPGTRSPHGKR